MSAPACPERIEFDCGPVQAIDLALYAAASGDHNPLHLDAEVARAAGFDKPVVHGMYTMACVGRVFTQRFGVRALRSLSARFTGVAKLGDRIVIEATLAGIDAGIATYALRAHSTAGTELVTGSARVVLAR